MMMARIRVEMDGLVLWRLALYMIIQTSMSRNVEEKLEVAG
jgi:hypothetical protein